ncbi:MAG: GNAT family N-acetyltransferase [Candidatus Helarchaeota archaeon]
MENLIEFRIFKEPDFRKITECIGDNPKQRRWKEHPEWEIKLLKFHAPDYNLYIAAFDGEKLVGCLIAHEDQLLIKNKAFKCIIIAITEVLMDYRKQGIASRMLKKLLEQIKNFDFDFILAFQTAGRGGKNILKNEGFQKIHKYGHATKVLDKKTMENLLDLNPVLKKLAMKLVNSNIGRTEPLKGVIRLADNQDLEQIVELLNKRGKNIEITSYWTKENLKHNKDWRYKIYVYEVDGEILASVIRYEEISILGENEFLCGFLKELAFKEGIQEIDKEVFIYHVLKRFKNDNIPNVSYPTPKPWIKILKKTGFRVLPGDERTVFIKPISNNAKRVLEQIGRFRFVNVFLIC